MINIFFKDYIYFFNFFKIRYGEDEKKFWEEGRIDKRKKIKNIGQKYIYIYLKIKMINKINQNIIIIIFIKKEIF